MPPTKRKRKLKQGRARKNGRVLGPIPGGVQFRLYRTLTLDPEGLPHRYERWIPPGQPGHQFQLKRQKDSVCHRYKRELGFLLTGEPNPLNLNQVQQDALHTSNKTIYRPSSSFDRAKAQSQFECYAQEVYPTDAYTLFLQRCSTEMDAANTSPPTPTFGTEAMMAPSETLLLAWTIHLREERGNKVSTIEKNISMISGTLLECTGRTLKCNIRVNAYLANAKRSTDDRDEPATVFSPHDLFPLLWNGVWSADVTSPHHKRVRLWAMLLVQFALMARSCEVSQEFCPLLSSLKLPSRHQQSHWLSNGMPAFLQVELLDWKGRPARKKGVPHRLRIMCNPLDFRFCPVFWVLEHLNGRTDLDDPLALLFTPVSASTYRKQFGDLLDRSVTEEACVAAGVDPSLADFVSSHSVRRTAAQWAARCGTNLITVRDVGRWETLEHLAKYVSMGAEDHQQAKRLAGGADPIYLFWVFDSMTKVDTMDSSGFQNRALAPRAAYHQ